LIDEILSSQLNQSTINDSADDQLIDLLEEQETVEHLIDDKKKSYTVTNIMNFYNESLHDIIKYNHPDLNISKEEACKRGTYFHNIIKSKVMSNQFESKLNKEDSNIVKMVINKLKEVKFEPMEFEKKLESSKHSYTGICDLVASMEFENIKYLAIIEFKFPKLLKNQLEIKQCLMQAAAYAQAFNENNVCQVNCISILICYANKCDMHIVFKNDIESYFNQFLIEKEKYIINKISLKQ
jgi:hypothetical protein